MPDGEGNGMATFQNGIEAADELQNLMETQQWLTTEHEMWVQEQVRKWAAMRESNRRQLKILINWPEDRQYIVDPLAGKIAEAFADLLFGEDPTFTAAQTAQLREKQALAKAKAKLVQAQAAAKAAAAGLPAPPPSTAPAAPDTAPNAADVNADQDAYQGEDESTPPAEPPDGDVNNDQELLDNLVEANNLPSELRHAEEICSSEGEVWWRIYTDRGQSDYPILEWYSRSHVRPLFRGRKLVAAGFVSEIFKEEYGQQWTVYRYVEIQAEGYVRNLLYRGSPDSLGARVPLTERPETKSLMDDWKHGFDMLAGRIPNKLGRDRRYGVSDYQGVEDLLFSLNEATTIGHENARLTAKKRVAVPREALDEGQFDAGEDVIIVDEPLDATMGMKGAANNKFAVLEYSFDAGSLIAHKDDIAAIILTRVGIAEQFINANSKSATSMGQAASGTSLRVRLIPTTLAAKGKGRFWDDTMPKQLLLMQLIDALPEPQGGFGRKWAVAGEMPVVERQEPLPQDEQEVVTQHATAVTAEIESRKTAISDMHPDWDADQIQDELDQIISEQKTFAPPAPIPPPFGGGDRGRSSNGPGPGEPDQPDGTNRGPQ